jgi:oligopeptide/dipeptide ABC transporter ATP-binding protein
MMVEPLLTVRDLRVSAASRAGGHDVVTDVSLDVHRGQAVGLVGESGSGKSLTLRAILGLLPRGLAVTRGRIVLDGTDVVTASRSAIVGLRGVKAAMIFQDPMTALNPVMTVGDQIAEAPRRRMGLSRRAATARALELMDMVGIAESRRRYRAYPHEFSGGMRQRVVIATALSCSPELVLCDEPTTALDVTLQKQVLDILVAQQRERGLAILFVTHDLAVVSELCERVSVMYAGEIVEEGRTQDVLARPRHGYTHALLRSVPTVSQVGSELATIPGTPLAPGETVHGCAFEPRCGFHAEECRVGDRFRLTGIDAWRATACIRHEVVYEASAGPRSVSER